MQVVPHSALSFSRLVAYLSRPVNLASGLHVRNTLLSAYNGQHLYPADSNSLPTGTETSQDARRWATLLDFLKAPEGSVTAFGAVPPSISLSSTSTSPTSESTLNGNNDEGDHGEEPWALVVTAMRWKTPAGEPKPPRVQVWINPRPASSPLTEAEWDNKRSGLARWIFDQWVPTYGRSLKLMNDGDGPSRQPIVFSGMEQYLVEICRRTLDDSGRGEFQWENPCVQFLRRVDLMAPEKVELPPGWKEGTITEDDVELVRSSNKLAFPADMIRSRLHISVMLRQEGDLGKSSAMGWAYTHEDLSIGSLHVLPQYRRARALPAAVADGAVATGVGATVVAPLEPKIAHAARIALLASGATLDGQQDGSNAEEAATWGPTPCCAMVEVENAVSQAFFTKLGYQRTISNSWVGVAVDV